MNVDIPNEKIQKRKISSIAKRFLRNKKLYHLEMKFQDKIIVENSRGAKWFRWTWLY